jgi:ribosomal protein L7/L12
MPEPTFWIVLAVLGLSMIIAIVQGRDRERLARLERKIDALLAHAGVNVAALVDKEVGELLRAGKKIEAIRVYREFTGVGLAQAKAHVEGLGRTGP